MSFNLRQNIALVIGFLTVLTVLFFIVQRMTRTYYLNLENNIAVAFITLFVLYVMTYIKLGSSTFISRSWLSLRNVSIFVIAIALTWLIFFIVNNSFTGFLLYRKIVLVAVLSGVFFILLECFVINTNDDDDDEGSRHH